MKLPLHFIWRNLMRRRLTTALTAGGMALVVFVFATVLMMRAGLEQTLTATGLPDNVVAIRKGSQTEVQSGLSRTEAAIIDSDPNIALDNHGRRLSSHETVVLISLNKKGSGCTPLADGSKPKDCASKPSNIVVRGSGEIGLALRPQVKLVAGRMFRPGSSEVIVGSAIANGFEGVQLGASLHFARRDWLVVGLFDAGKTGFNSEIWGDAEQMIQAFRRLNFSAVIFHMQDATQFEAMRTRLEGDPRMTGEFKIETQFYADQSQAMSTFITVLGTVLSIVFSLGAIIGAMITMYAAVANRTGEIGALRALGFRKRSILAAFMAESLLLSMLGGAVGLAVASGMQFFTVSTMNFQTFSELAFSFAMTPSVMAKSLVFALFMGLVGGFLPAVRAARMQIVDALRAA